MVPCVSVWPSPGASAPPVTPSLSDPPRGAAQRHRCRNHVVL